MRDACVGRWAAFLTATTFAGDALEALRAPAILVARLLSVFFFMFGLWAGAGSNASAAAPFIRKCAMWQGRCDPLWRRKIRSKALPSCATGHASDGPNRAFTTFSAGCAESKWLPQVPPKRPVGCPQNGGEFPRILEGLPQPHQRSVEIRAHECRRLAPTGPCQPYPDSQYSRGRTHIPGGGPRSERCGFPGRVRRNRPGKSQMISALRPWPSPTQCRGSSKTSCFRVFTKTLQWMANGRPGANKASTRLFSSLQGLRILPRVFEASASRRPFNHGNGWMRK